MKAKLKEITTKYGKVGIAAVVSFKLINYSLYGVIYVAVDKGVDFKKIAEKVGVTVSDEKWNYIDSLGPATTAFIIYKSLAPVRYPVVFALVTGILKKYARK